MTAVPVPTTASTATGGEPFRVVLVSGGTSDPSSTRLLGDRIVDRVAAAARDRGASALISTVDLRSIAGEITTAIVSGLIGPGLTRAIDLLRAADGVVAAAPVYKAEASGLFTSFFHVLDNDLLIGKPVVLAATAGTSRHALVIDNSMRALFAFLRALTAPTSVFAAGEDWNSTDLGTRIDRAAFELVLLMESGFATAIRDGSWGSYQHEYGGDGGAGIDVDLSTDLMRLATGGSA